MQIQKPFKDAFNYFGFNQEIEYIIDEGIKIENLENCSFREESNRLPTLQMAAEDMSNCLKGLFENKDEFDRLRKE